MAILLIGSTGNGKSALGNFLLDPCEDHIFKKKSFKTAQTSRPETQLVQCKSGNIKLQHHQVVNWTIVDTPGLNESDVKDLQHMIQIIESLNEMKAIQACIIVIRFSSKIDIQYKTTLQYYSKLLPSLFEKNVLVVVTDFATTARAELLREKQGIDVQQIIRDTVQEVMACANLKYKPALFALDCLPLDDEREGNLQERDGLLHYIKKLDPIGSTSLRVAKTERIQLEDKENISHYEGEIRGYSEALKRRHENARVALEKIETMQQKITGVDKSLQSNESRLRQIDSSDTVISNSWHLEKTWKIWRQTATFDLESKWPITNVQRKTNGHCEWVDYKKIDEYSVTGKVIGEYFRGLYASVELETEKRHMHQPEITSIKEEIHRDKQHRLSLEKRLKDIQNEYDEHKNEIELLTQYIEMNRMKIKESSDIYMSLDEARKRFAALMQ